MRLRAFIAAPAALTWTWAVTSSPPSDGRAKDLHVVLQRDKLHCVGGDGAVALGAELDLRRWIVDPRREQDLPAGCR